MLAALLGLFVGGCAGRPSPEELRAADCGRMPTNYQEAIRLVTPISAPVALLLFGGVAIASVLMPGEKKRRPRLHCAEDIVPGAKVGRYRGRDAFQTAATR